jgi:hypothetical protein
MCGAGFPTTRAAWPGSLSCLLLQRFQIYLNRLPPDLADRKINEASRQVLPLMSALASLEHIPVGTKELQEREEEEEDPFFKTKKKKSQKQRKASNATRTRKNTVVVDPRLFTAVDFDMPTSMEELLVAEMCLLERLQEVLKVRHVYLTFRLVLIYKLVDQVLLVAFENPELGSHAKALFFKQPLQYVPAKPTLNSLTAPATETSTITAPDPGAYPHIRPLAAAKYFDEGNGLGAWNVIVSGRAINDLRQMQKRDSHVFAMVHKKIT